jgi:uncharacterized delta-60 repeat protein
MRQSIRKRGWLSLLLGSVLLGLVPSAAYGAGALDPTFDGDGKVVTDLGGTEYARDVAIPADGKIVAAGPRALLRYNFDGSLDTTFDGDGKLDPGFLATSLAIQSDGKLVVAGCCSAIARYKSDGSLDTSFDGDGKAVTDVNPRAVAIQADGKIVVAGAISSDWALARYNADGSVDTTFDGDGVAVTDFPGDASAGDVVVQSDGKIVAAGSSCLCDAMHDEDFIVTRYNTDGSFDPTFDGDGKVMTSFGGSWQFASGVAIQSDGKIVGAGSACCFGTTNLVNFALARYDGNGNLDTSFDGDGKVLTGFGTHAEAFDNAIQADGKIVAAGETWGSAEDFALARYLPDGSLDPNFDFDGRVTTDFGKTDNVYRLAIAPGGKIVAGGGTGTIGGTHDVALARYTSTGTTLPKLSVSDVTRFEGNAGLTSFSFTVSLSTASSQTVTVSRQTANGSASAPADYTALAPATISFAPGETTKTVVVKVKGELAVEPNETFFLNLSSPTGATIADGQGTGTIRNDDLSASASCTITGSNRSEVLNGTAGNDVICGARGDDEIYGHGGNDVLKGEEGDDLLVGGDGYDLLVGAAGTDDGRGGNGNDTLRGGDRADTLLGGANSDALFGEIGADTLNTKDNVSANDSADGGTESDSCVFDSGDFVTSCP